MPGPIIGDIFMFLLLFFFCYFPSFLSTRFQINQDEILVGIVLVYYFQVVIFLMNIFVYV